MTDRVATSHAQSPIRRRSSSIADEATSRPGRRAVRADLAIRVHARLRRRSAGERAFSRGPYSIPNTRCLPRVGSSRGGSGRTFPRPSPAACFRPLVEPSCAATPARSSESRDRRSSCPEAGDRKPIPPDRRPEQVSSLPEESERCHEREKRRLRPALAPCGANQGLRRAISCRADRSFESHARIFRGHAYRGHCKSLDCKQIARKPVFRWVPNPRQRIQNSYLM